MNVYFHAIFYIKLYVRVMSARYLCLFVGSSGLQAMGSIQQVFIQIFSLDTNVLVDKSLKYGYAVVLPPYCM